MSRIALGAGLGAGLILLLFFLWPRSKPASAEQLFAVGQDSGATQEQREKAILGLAKADKKGKEYLRELLKSPDVEAKAAAISGLAECRDFESMPQLLDLLDDPSDNLRRRAASASMLILGRNYPYDAAAAASARAPVIALMRKEYQAMKKSPPPMYR